MKAKPTQGPWKRDGQGRTISSPKGVICECFSHMGIDEADANENLIAAAPALLAMLKAAQNKLEAIATYHNGPQRTAISALCEKITVTVKQAEGGGA